MPAIENKIEFSYRNISQLQSLVDGISVICVNIINSDPLTVEDSTGRIVLRQGNLNCVTDLDYYLLLISTKAGQHYIERGHSIPSELCSIYEYLSTTR